MPQDLDFYNWEKFQRVGNDPGQSYELIPDSSSPSYVGVPVRINRLGFRDRELTLPKPETVFRVLAVGDSVTFGFGVRSEDTYAERLEALLNAEFDGSARKAEVVNAGIGGTGLDYYYHFLKKKAPELEPDLVLIGITLNDISNYGGSRVGESGDSVQFGELVHKVNRALLLHSHLYQAVYMNLKSFFYRIGVLDINETHDYDFLVFRPASERRARAWNSSLELLGRIIEEAGNREISVLLVVFPTEVQLSRETLELYRRELGVQLDDSTLVGAPQIRLAEFARAHGVPLVDLLPRFREAEDPLFLQNQAISHDWVHLSPSGHEVAAEEILRGLRGLELFQESKTQ